jgi:hypothetical protein
LGYSNHVGLNTYVRKRKIKESLGLKPSAPSQRQTERQEM